MTVSHRDPYLWLHLAGLATVPIWLDLCLAGLAVGDPVVPPWLELTTLAGVGTVPILWMQWQRPFYIFSLLVLALRPDTLSADRRRLLSLHRSWLSRGLVVVSAIALFLVLAWLYRLAPMAAAMTPFAGQPRAVGWLICAIAFLLANLFVQVPAIVVSLLMTPAGRVLKTAPYDTQEILRDFTVLGLRVGQILPVGAVPEGPAVAVAAHPTSPMGTIATPTTADGDQPLAAIAGMVHDVAITSPMPAGPTIPAPLIAEESEIKAMDDSVEWVTPEADLSPLPEMVAAAALMTAAPLTAEAEPVTASIFMHADDSASELATDTAAGIVPDSTLAGEELDRDSQEDGSTAIAPPPNPPSLSLSMSTVMLSPANLLAPTHVSLDSEPLEESGGDHSDAAASQSIGITDPLTVEAVASLDEIDVEAEAGDAEDQDAKAWGGWPTAAGNPVWQLDK